MKLKVYSFLIIFSFLPSLHAQTLKKADVTATQEIQFKLSNLETIAPGIQYKVYQDSLELKAYEEKYRPLAADDLLSHRVVLQNVNSIRCQQLKDAFARENSLVDCASLKNTSTKMDLRYFLEPVIQATAGNVFLNQDIILSAGYKVKDGEIIYPANSEETDSSGGYLTRKYVELTNCWGTAWEVARRSKDNYSVEVGSDLLAFMTNKKNVKEVIAKTKDLTQLKQKLNQIKYGDILLVLDNTGYIMHAATFIDQQLVFEKKGNETKYAFRMSKLEQITKEYKRFKPQYHVIRPKAKFPTAESIEKKWTYSSGPQDEDYEGLSGVTYQQVVTFKLIPQGSTYVLSDRINAYSENTIAKLEAAQSESEIVDALAADEFVKARLSESDVKTLAQEILNPTLPDLSRKALLLRWLYFRK